MKFSEITRRLTSIGISIPFFGISVGWNPTESDATVAKRVITFLENRRVLYDPYNVQFAEYCVQSVNDMRQFLTEQISIPSLSKDLEKNMRAMRYACKKFMGKVIIPPVGSDPKYGFYDTQYTSVLTEALAELRTTFGLQIGILAAQYGIDIIEEDLASIIPASDEDE